MELEQNAVIETEITPIQKTGGTSDYENLTNKPSINNIELEGNKTLEELGIYNYDDTEIKRDIQSLEDTKVDREVNKGLSTNDYTNEEKSKLASLENYDDTEVKADISALEDVETAQNQEIVDLKVSKADKSEIPDVSDFITNSVNDLVNYYLKSETYTKTEVNNLIGAINQFHYEIVQALPITGENNILYLVPKSTSQTNNVYDEYVYASGWEKIGDTQIDLSNYVTTTQLNTALADYTTTANLTTLLAGKQDSLVSGTNIKTINNESILGSGDITISGGDGIKIFSTRKIDLRNDVEPGIYLTDSDTDKMWIYDLQGSRNIIDMAWGFFYVTKKYSEVAVDEYFIYYHDSIGNNCRLQKTNDAKGISTGPTMGSGTWTNRSNVLLKNNAETYTPTGNYNPATKKYVDDSIASAITTTLGGNY